MRCIAYINLTLFFLHLELTIRKFKFTDVVLVMFLLGGAVQTKEYRGRQCLPEVWNSPVIMRK